MGKGSSSSESTQATTTQTTDARVGADNGAVVIQAGGQQNISFSPEMAAGVKDIVNSITDFSNGVVATAGDILSQSLKSNEAQAAAVLDFGKSALAVSPSTSESKSSGVLSNQAAATASPNLNMLVLGGVAAIIVITVMLKKGK